jgi:hypothetical protein
MMDKVHIKSLGRPKLLKLMRGGAVRVKSPESASETMEMFIMPEHSKTMMNKFGKGQAHTLKLSPSEIEKNSMEGGSLYSMAKKALKYASPVLKQGARLGIATGSAALAASNPALIPFIPAGAAMLGGLSDSAFDELSNMNVDDEEDDYGSPQMNQYGRMARDYATDYATDYAEDYVEKQPAYKQYHQQLAKAKSSPYSQLGNAGTRELAQYGNLGSRYEQVSNQAKAAQQRQSLTPRQSRQASQTQTGRRASRGRGMFAGGGLYAGNGLYAGDMRGRGFEKSTVSVGGNLISAFGGSHPATMSAPMSVNFASRNFMSPAMAAMIQ